MAPKIPKNATDEQHWVCEDCGRANIGDNPPDECYWCAHTYFENLADILRERAGTPGVEA